MNSTPEVVPIYIYTILHWVSFNLLNKSTVEFMIQLHNPQKWHDRRRRIASHDPFPIIRIQEMCVNDFWEKVNVTVNAILLYKDEVSAAAWVRWPCPLLGINHQTRLKVKSRDDQFHLVISPQWPIITNAIHTSSALSNGNLSDTMYFTHPQNQQTMNFGNDLVRLRISTIMWDIFHIHQWLLHYHPTIQPVANDSICLRHDECEGGNWFFNLCIV